MLDPRLARIYHTEDTLRFLVKAAQAARPASGVKTAGLVDDIMMKLFPGLYESGLGKMGLGLLGMAATKPLRTARPVASILTPEARIDLRKTTEPLMDELKGYANPDPLFGELEKAAPLLGGSF